MKKMILFASVMPVCASMAFAQIRPRVNVDGKKLNYLSDSLVIVYSPDSVELRCSGKDNPKTVTIYGSECDSSFEYTCTNSKIDRNDPARFGFSSGDREDDHGTLSRLDFNVPFYHKVVNKTSVHCGRLVRPDNFGMALLEVNSGDVDFRTQRSYEVFYNMCDDYFKLSSFMTFNYGLGFSWKNFAMTKGGMMTKDDEGNIRIGEWPEKSEPKVSKLRVFSFTFPFVFGVNVYHGIGFSVGPVVNLNASSSIVDKYRLNGKKQKDRYKRAHCNLATVDMMFQLNFKDVGIYAEYSPMNIMDSDYWPEFKHWAIGLTVDL